jgi:hypothetical protein
MPAPIEDPWVSYARTVVEVDASPHSTYVLRAAPAGHVGPWPWASTDPRFVLTAWDPGDARPGETVNRARQAALEADLRALTSELWPATGVDPVSGHAEEGVLVGGMSEADARAAGARYGQDAIFRWTPSEWCIVACRDERRLASGWSLVIAGE